MTSTLVERLPWDEFLRRFRWEQGQHVSVVAPTGVGKSVLMTELQRLRGYVLFVGVKPRDETLERLKRPEFGSYVERLKVPPIGRDGPTKPRVLLWPRPRTAASYPWQASVIRQAIDDAWEQTNWCVAVDEVSYLVKRLRLLSEMEMLWEQGRSLGISVLSATQRPRWVPLTMYSSASHLFLGGTNDAEDLRRLGGLNGADTKLVRAILQQLPSKRTHELLYVNAQTGDMSVILPPFKP